MNKKSKLLRITTVPISMNIILKGQLQFMQRHFDVVGVTSPDETHFREVEKREGIAMRAVKMARTISILRDVYALIQLFLLLRKERPSIVHTHTPKAGLLGMVASWLARVPVRLHTVAGMPLMEVRGTKRKLLELMEKITFRCAQKVYPNSIGLKDIIIREQLCPTEKLKVIANGGSNGINAEYFKPGFVENPADYRRALRAQHGITPDHIVFLFVGRIAREKGMRELIDAFTEIQQMRMKSPSTLVLAGTFEKHYGVLENDLEKRIHDNPDILFLGRFDDVRPCYLMSDVYVFPSYREGFPNSLLEAGAMGLPSIATDINGCNEIIKPGINGVLIAAKDKHQLKRAMIRMIEDRPHRTFLSSNARSEIVTKYKRELIWQELLSEYREMLELHLID